ncbi:MFS transporter [Methanotorris formicicus]|uniref:Major facilitator superfamily MFS_1 n=1 Tax=Methanotorris formicicus Mc-S-70 TaxID=647171 RepID=H1KYW6_9EURY|nr:MFS transporter [Methanotorris formicicus]EHP86701.1 major facilitator superfamily MFS_1 [Methanotorris formicicus Mc-S-70]
MGNKKAKNVVVLGIVSFLNDVSSEIISAILPMFIISLGGDSVVVGLIGGVRDSIPSIFKVFFGYLSDRFGKRKIFVFVGYFLSTIFKLLLPFSKTWEYVAVFSGFERIGKGIREAPRDAIIAESMPKERGKAFGIHRALDTFGAVLGSMTAFILIYYLVLDFKSILLIASLPAFFSLIPLFFVKEVEKANTKNFKPINLKLLAKPLKQFILISTVFALANFSYMFYILKVQEHLSEFAVEISIILYVIFNISYAIFSIPFGILSDKIGKGKVIAFGYLIFSLTALGFVLFKSLKVFFVLFVFYGVAYAILNTNQRAYVSDLSPNEIKATALGVFQTATGLIALPSSLIAGFLWKISSNLTFIYGCVLGLVSCILMIQMLRGK